MKSELENRDADAPQRGVRVRASLPLPAERSRTAIVVSTMLHLLLIALLIRVTASVVQPTHSPIGDAFQLAIGGGGGGGKGGAVVTAPPVTHAPEPVVPPPPPVVPTVIPPPPAAVTDKPVPAIEAAPAASALAAGTGGGSGGGTGTGTGPGTGSGVGPGSGSGSGGGTGAGGCPTAPEGRQMILPAPDPPKPIRGREIEVTLLVDATGKVLSAELKPAIADRNYAKKFEDLMRGYSFLPARDCSGRPIAATAVVTVTLN